MTRRQETNWEASEETFGERTNRSVSTPRPMGVQRLGPRPMGAQRLGPRPMGVQRSSLQPMGVQRSGPRPMGAEKGWGLC